MGPPSSVWFAIHCNVMGLYVYEYTYTHPEASDVCDFLFFKEIYFIFDYVYTVEKDVHPCRPLIRVAWAKEWGKLDETVASNLFFFLPVSGGRDRRGPFPAG